MYTWVEKGPDLVKRVIIKCDGNTKYNCFDLVTEEDRPLQKWEKLPFDKSYSDEPVKLEYIQEGVKFEEAGTLKRFKGESLGKASSYTIEMTVKK